VVEDPAAALSTGQAAWIHSNASSLAKVLRLAFQAQSRSVRRFGRRFGSHPTAAIDLFLETTWM